MYIAIFRRWPSSNGILAERAVFSPDGRPKVFLAVVRSRLMVESPSQEPYRDHQSIGPTLRDASCERARWPLEGHACESGIPCTVMIQQMDSKAAFFLSHQRKACCCDQKCPPPTTDPTLGLLYLRRKVSESPRTRNVERKEKNDPKGNSPSCQQEPTTSCGWRCVRTLRNRCCFGGRL